MTADPRRHTSPSVASRAVHPGLLRCGADHCAGHRPRSGRHRRHRGPAPRGGRPLLLFACTLALLLLPLAAVAAPAPATGGGPRAAAASPPRFAWPLRPDPDVTRPFDEPASPYGPGHRGVDLAAPPGGHVLAAAPGVVVFAGPLAGRGVVSIDHDAGLRTTYEPLAPAVRAGEQVHAGQLIGTVTPGHLGCTGGACLHWGVRRGHEYLDPLRLVRVRTVLTLKPWAGTGT